MDQTFRIFVFLGLMGVTRVIADNCAPYVGEDFAFHQGQQCILSFCAGSCTNRYCSILPGTMLDQSQVLCILTNLYFVIIGGIVIAILIIASVITCFCKSLCLCCHLFRPQARTGHVTTSLTVNNTMPPQPLIAIPAASGYQPVPSHSQYVEQPAKAYLPPPYPAAANLAYVDSP